ncbi:MAG: hypothetical protein HZC47_11625 [Methanobacterium sp.]|uniref:hypothetical protein n=1 Tax=Methanobacterium sp. TaxID=2164 RepID=UPI003D64C6FA|nr:hypothetical protein [Methanobacterium sp.]
MKNKLIIGIISFLVIFVSVSGCINTNPADNSTNTANYSSDQGTQGSTNTKSSTSSSSSKSSGSKKTSSTVCPQCNGYGTVTCYNTVTGGETCDGTGIVQGGSTAGQTCRVCGGTGSITCPTCGGTGHV